MTHAQETGYASASYAASLAEFGRPVELPQSGGWLLSRDIPNSLYRDAKGCYPLFVCRDPKGLDDDLRSLAGQLVSVTLVADPFMEASPEQLANLFPDKMAAFKTHYLLDLDIPHEKVIHKSTIKLAKEAQKAVTIEICTHPLDYLDDWVRLYDCLIQRHNLKGIHCFSRQSFAVQMQTPGFVMLRAAYCGQTVGIFSWYLYQDRAYAHLLALSQDGYRLRASYALYWESIRYFIGKVRWLNLGGAAGCEDSATDGLARFKRQWASGERMVYLCGRILQPEVYHRLCQQLGAAPNTNYFPAYRAGEFQKSARTGS